MKLMLVLYAMYVCLSVATKAIVSPSPVLYVCIVIGISCQNKYAGYVYLLFMIIQILGMWHVSSFYL